VTIGMFFLGLAIGLVFGMVIHWVFGEWDQAWRDQHHRSTRRPW